MHFKKLLFLLFVFISNLCQSQTPESWREKDTLFNEFGKIYEIYSDNDQTSIRYSYYENGTIAEIVFDTLKQGIPFTYVKRYYPNKNLKCLFTRITVSKGIVGKTSLDGECIQFDEDGNVKSKSTLIENTVFHGMTTIYYENGAKKMEIPYQNDQINGELISYYPNGNINYKRVYAGKVLLKITYFDSLGTPIPNTYSATGKSQINHFQYGIKIGTATFKNGKFKTFDADKADKTFFVQLNKKTFLPNLMRWE